MKNLLNNWRIFMAAAMLISTSAFAQANTADGKANDGYGTAVYATHIQVYSSNKLVADKTETMHDRKLSSFDGVFEQDHKVSYHVELTPYLMTDGYVGVQVNSAVITKLPNNTVKAGGKTFSFPVNSRCSVGATPKVKLGEASTVYGSSDLNVDDSKSPIPGCSMVLTITKA